MQTGRLQFIDDGQSGWIVGGPQLRQQGDGDEKGRNRRTNHETGAERDWPHALVNVIHVLQFDIFLES